MTAAKSSTSRMPTTVCPHPGTQVAAVPQPFQQYRRATDGHGTAQVEAAGAGYAQQFVRQQHSQQGQGADFNDADDQHPEADFADAPPAQFQPDAKEQQHQPQLGQQLDGVPVADDRMGQGKRPDNQPGQQIPQHRRLAQQPRQRQPGRGHRHCNGEILEEAGAGLGKTGGKYGQGEFDERVSFQ